MCSNCCYTDWSLAFQGEGCGFESWDWKFFSSFLFLHFFPSFPYTARLPNCLLVCGQGPARLSGGPTSTINISVVVYLAYGSTANFLFRGPIAKINISKEREGYGDRSGPRILEIDPVILKLSRFYQVQSERERTLVMVAMFFKAILILFFIYFFRD